MINHQLLLYDAQGRIRCTMQAPREFNGGCPTRNRLLCITNSPAQVYAAGLGYTLNGAICTTQALNPAPPGGVLDLDADGAARSTNNPPTFWYAGLPFAANNLMSLGVPE
jgi:hypothetical protein